MHEYRMKMDDVYPTCIINSQKWDRV